MGNSVWAAASRPLTWSYRLIEGSQLVDDTKALGRPTLLYSLRGTFDLVLASENPLFSSYRLTNIVWTAGGDPHYQVIGHGELSIGGEVAYLQNANLDLQINGRSVTLTNAVKTVGRRWPMIGISLNETPENPIQFYTIDLRAAPLREIWFSTASGLTPGSPASGTSRVSNGDLISLDGRVVRRNSDVVNHLGIMPVVPDLGLAAVDIGAGGEVLFAIAQNVFSETLGPIQPGDLLSDRGRMVKRNQDLTAKFVLMPPTPDLGLDAVHVNPDGEVFFSVKSGAFSEQLGRSIQPGDVLSSAGQVARSNHDLLAQFHPAATNQDFGLDALYVWPSGEIWFSTEQGFPDAQLGVITDGDLLSDQGYVVFRNLELVGAFSPLEDLANFGLHDVYLVTDVTAPAPAPNLLTLQVDLQSQQFTLRWEGKGRAFQLEKAADIAGPFAPIGPVDVRSQFTGETGLGGSAQAFFRVRQW